MLYFEHVTWVCLTLYQVELARPFQGRTSSTGPNYESHCVNVCVCVCVCLFVSLSAVFISVQLLITPSLSYKWPNCEQFCNSACLCQTWWLCARLSNIYSLWFVWNELPLVCTHRLVRPLQDRIGTSSESDAREWNVCPGNTWKWVKRQRSAKHPMVCFQETFVLRRQIVVVCLPYHLDKPHGNFALSGRC